MIAGLVGRQLLVSFLYIYFFEIFKGCKLEGFEGLSLLLVRGSHHHLNNPLCHIHRCRLDFK